MRKAYEISNNDLRFVALLEAENDLWDHKLIHRKSYALCWDWQSWETKRPPNQEYALPKCHAGDPNYFWRHHDDRGFCGISDGYYRYITEDPRFKSDPEWQIEQCYQLYAGGTTFYGRSRIHETVKRFYFE